LAKERREAEAEEEARRRRVLIAQSEKDLQKQLFLNDEDGGEGKHKGKKSKKGPPSSKFNRRPIDEDDFDEDDIDDFIEDDLGDGGDMRGRPRRERSGWGFDEGDDYDASGREGVSEAQWNEANEIFGVDYMNMMEGREAGEDEDDADALKLLKKRKKKERYREQGVSIDGAGESDSDVTESDDELDKSDAEADELFPDDDDEEAGKRKEDAATRRFKRVQERKARRAARKAEKRRAALRRAYEPIVLVENFCTPKDDEIRSKDIPERFQMSKTLKILEEGAHEDDNDAAEEKAMWIMSKIPAIASEFFSSDSKSDGKDLDDSGLNKKQRAILNSITASIRYMRKEKFEPQFIRKYRMDYVTSVAVRENLYEVMDQISDFNKFQFMREKAEALLASFSSTIRSIATQAGESLSSGTVKDTSKQEQLIGAREKLEQAVRLEASALAELDLFQKENQDLEENNDEDQDDLFGDDDDEDEDKAKRKIQLAKLKNHYDTVRALLEERAERVASLTTEISAQGPEGDVDVADMAASVQRKLCPNLLWNETEYRQYLVSLTEPREVADVIEYLQLIVEGHDALMAKTKFLSDADREKTLNRRSKRFDRDYYRTCVADGLRAIAYKLFLSPLRVGIKLETEMTVPGGFKYNRRLAGEAGNLDLPVDPTLWMAPRIEVEPDQFAAEMTSTGELMYMANKDVGQDPLAGCRYVAAMELAYEPRVRKHLREVYRQHAVLTTRPTSKGLSMIDTFHEHYGLHLIREKPVKDHFADAELLAHTHLDPISRREMEEDLRRKEKESCLQFLRLTKAERAGFIKIKLTLPNSQISRSDDWYKDSFAEKDQTDLGPFLNVLEKVCFPLGVSPNDAGASDTEGLWREERLKMLRQALTSFILPQFETELLRDLSIAAVKFGVSETADALKALAFEGPYRPTHLLGENRFLKPTGELPIVGLCIALDTREASYFAALNSRGELKASLPIPAGTRLTVPGMRQKVLQFLVTNRPAAVLVGTGGGLLSRMISRQMQDIVSEATVKWNNRYVQGEDEDDDDYEQRTKEFRQLYMAGSSNNMMDDDEDNDEEVWKCNVDILDDNVAQLFGRSVRGTKEFPDTQTNLKCAIAIARYAQDPLAELCYAWSVASDAGTFGAEMLYINVHPMQQLIPKAALLKAYERVLCKAVAEVGVDVNAACSIKHQLGLLQFVPGLGPRKAANLKQNVIRLGGIVPSRKYLLSKRLLGPTVYINCVAFLRIKPDAHLLGRRIHPHPLDNTRVHPDVYIGQNYALKIAVDAIEAHISDNDEEEYLTAVRGVMKDSRKQIEPLYLETKRQWEKKFGATFSISGWDPRNIPADHWHDKVEELDLDTFAEMIEQNTGVKLLSHLVMVKWEFRLPFEDPRKPMEPLSGDKLFRLLTGESDWTLRPGKEVTGHVIKNGDYGSRCKIEGDIPAFIALRNMSDDHVDTCEDIVTEHSVVTAIISEVKKDYFSVDLSLKMSDFRKPPREWRRPDSLPPIDKCFDYMAAAKLEEQKAKEREAHLAGIEAMLQRKKIGGAANSIVPSNPFLANNVVSRRACAHPCFRNAKNDEVNSELKSAGEAMVGEALIRPSSKNADSLALHWMLRPGVIRVIEIFEEDKDTDASIGNILKIKDETYGSIDEILGRYISPMNDKIEELVNHRKFLNRPESDVDEKLRALKKGQPSGVFYFLCWNEKYPGYASLRFILGQTPRDHPIGIMPSGFQWGNKQYNHLDRLLNDFKINPRGPGGNATVSKPTAPAQSKPSRWGAPRPPPPSARPPAPVAAPAQTGWGTATVPATGWGAPSASSLSTSIPPSGVPPAHNLPPPPPAYSSQASTRPPPPPGAPPAYQRSHLRQ